MRPIRLTVAAGGTSPVVPLDHNATTFNVGVALEVVAGANATLDVSSADVFATGYTPGADFIAVPGFSAQTANATFALTTPVRALRMRNTGSQPLTFTVVQAGLV